MKLAVIVGVAVLSVSSALFADTVYLKDGSTREGSVVKVTEKEVRLRVTHGKSVGVIAIPRENVERIVTGAPDPAKLREQGYSLMASEAFEDAIATFTELAAMQPASADAYGDLGLACTLARRFPEALDAYRRACGLAPEKPDFILGLGYAYRQLGKHDNAIEQYAQYVEKRPKDASGHRLMAEVYLAKKLYRKALQSAKRAVSLDKKDVQSRMVLAEVYRELDLVDGALGEANAAVELSPGLGEVYLLRARILLEAGREEEALGDLDKAAQLNPNLMQQAADIAAGKGEKKKEEVPGKAQPVAPGQPVHEEPKKPAPEAKKPEREEVAGQIKEAETEIDRVRELLNEAIRRLEELRAKQEKLKKQKK